MASPVPRDPDITPEMRRFLDDLARASAYTATIVKSDGSFYYSDGGVLNLVSVGAADSAGAGFRLLRIPN